MQYQPVHRPPSDYVRSLATDLWLALGVVAGLFLLMIGSIVYGLADTINGMDAGMVVKALGLFIVSAALFMGGILRNDMHHWVRVALILTAALLVMLVGFWGPF
jgi:cell division protein FtsW (lipid II flippase)